jgi:methyl-accepting chemotaxis protein
MNFTVSQRIWGGFICITLLLLMIGFNSLWRIGNIHDSTQEVNNLSLPALIKSSELKVEFTLMSKLAYESFYAPTAAKLNTLKSHFSERQATFDENYSKLKDVVKSDQKLYTEADEVGNTYEEFVQSVNNLFNDKASEINLRSAINEQLEEIELNAEDATTVVLDILDLEGLKSKYNRAYLAANNLETNLSSAVVTSNDIYTVKNKSTLDVVVSDQAFISSELDRNIELISAAVKVLDEDLYSDLQSYYTSLKSHLTGSSSLAENQRRLITATAKTQGDLASSEQATKAAIAQLNQLLNDANTLAFNLQQDVQSDVSKANFWTWGGMLVATLLAVIIASFTVRLITKPLAEVNRVLSIVSQGDMTQKLEENSHDEFGELAHSCNTVISSLRELITGIISRSTQLAAASEQTSMITSESSLAIKNQQAQVEQAATATTQMSSTSHGVSNSAVHALSEIKNADKEAERVKGISHENKHTIEKLALEVDEASRVINKLHQDSASIGSILDVIRGIAEQTNLLALNAAIEAARAGEQGRGFAVVADEVRSLASKTQESTQEIQSMIEALQAGAEEAVTAMTRGKQQAESCVDQSDLANEALNSITLAVSQAHDVSEEISTAAHEQQQVSEEISKRLESIVSIAEQTAEGANQTSISSTEVAKLAEELRLSVDQFKV